MPSQNAIRELMERIAVAGSPGEVYDSALKCLSDTLQVERASMLLFDEQHTMRFVAWTGLSDDYRRALDGHSPWAADETDARPLLVPDVFEDPSLQSHRHVFEAERVRALAFVPLRFGRKLLGKFMLYYAEPRTFVPEEVELAEIVAGHVAFALEHARIAGELEGRIESERRQRRNAESEAALRRQNARQLHLALQAGRMGTWSWDIAEGRVEWSRELEAIHGLEPGTFGGSVEAFEQDMHPEDRERVRSAIQRAVAGQTDDYVVEYRILPQHGRLRWVAARGRVLHAEDGRPVRMVGICSDVSERKRLEEAEAFVSQASRMLATTLEPTAAVQRLARIVVPRLADWCLIQSVGADGKLVPLELSHADPDKAALGRRILRPPGLAGVPGMPDSVLLTGESSLVQVISPALLATVAEDEEHLRELESLGLRSMLTVPLKARGRLLGTLTFISAESKGTYGPADLRLAEEIGSWAALAIDNAQLLNQAQEARKLAEEASRQLQTLAETTADLASLLDPDEVLRQLAERVVERLADYCVTYAYDGRGGIRRLGLAHRLPGKEALVERLTDAGAATLDTPGAGTAIRTGRPILATEIPDEQLEHSAQNAAHLEVLRRLGPLSAIIVPLEARGRTVGAIALATTDDSGRRYGPPDLQLATALASRVGLLVDNARLYAEARAAIDARDQMIAVVSHDLRNPLQTIITSASLLKRNPSPERSDRSLRGIEVASSHMKRLLQDLLDISSMDAGQFSVSLDVVPAGSLIDEAYTLFQPVAEERSITLQRVAPAELPAVLADRSRILQVLSNLLSNALKFTQEGGSVRLEAVPLEGMLRFAVADNGPGICGEHRSKVFQRFWRARPELRLGAGLGLAVAKGIVTAHGGDIRVESEEGRGSTFCFDLPVADAPAEALPTADHDDSAAMTGGRRAEAVLTEGRSSRH